MNFKLVYTITYIAIVVAYLGISEFPPFLIAVWVKADGFHKSDMMVLLKIKILPTFQCNTNNIIHCYLNQF